MLDILLELKEERVNTPFTPADEFKNDEARAFDSYAGPIRTHLCGDVLDRAALTWRTSISIRLDEHSRSSAELDYK